MGIKHVQILEEQNGLCFWCGKAVKEPSIDHIIPKNAGGGYHRGNKAVCCTSCNQKKSGSLPQDFIKRKLMEIEAFLKSEGFKRYARR